MQFTRAEVQEQKLTTRASTRFLLPRTSSPAFYKTITRHIKDKRTPFKETEQTSEPGSDMADIKTKYCKKKKSRKQNQMKKKQRTGRNRKWQYTW